MAQVPGQQCELVGHNIRERLLVDAGSACSHWPHVGSRHVSWNISNCKTDWAANGHIRVKTRLEKGDGMSFAEFSYPLVQAWDWWHLFQRGVQLQIGGGDQFGNILAGAEAVKMIAKESQDYQAAARQAKTIDGKYGVDVTSDPLGFTVPLLTTSSGEKFGKSAGNAIWLDPQMTSIFELYQVSP